MKFGRRLESGLLEKGWENQYIRYGLLKVAPAQTMLDQSAFQLTATQADAHVLLKLGADSKDIGNKGKRRAASAWRRV